MTEQSLETEIALMHHDIKTMAEESRESRAEVRREIEGIKKDIAAMKQQSARWKGGIVVLMGLGGVVLALLNIVDKLSGFFKS